MAHIITGVVHLWGGLYLVDLFVTPLVLANCIHGRGWELGRHY